MTVAFAVEIALVALLATTVVYCAILERRLAALRKDQQSFKDAIGALNMAIASAGTSLRQLKAATATAAETLDDRLGRARSLTDELSLLVTSGERIASRIERSVDGDRAKNTATASRATPAVLANRLEGLRPQIHRPDAVKTANLGNVR